jgi:hypothetical protein
MATFIQPCDIWLQNFLCANFAQTPIIMSRFHPNFKGLKYSEYIGTNKVSFSLCWGCDTQNQNAAMGWEISGWCAGAAMALLLRY